MNKLTKFLVFILPLAHFIDLKLPSIIGGFPSFIILFSPYLICIPFLIKNKHSSFTMMFSSLIFLFLLIFIPSNLYSDELNVLALFKYIKLVIILLFIFSLLNQYSDNNLTGILIICKYFQFGIIFCFFTIILFPIIFTTGIKIGAAYTFGPKDNLFFFTSTIEPPIIVSLIFSFLLLLNFRTYTNRINLSTTFLHKLFYQLLKFLLLIFFGYFLFVINRRGPILSLFLSILTFYLLFLKFGNNKLLVFTTLIILLSSFSFWSYFNDIMLILSKNSIFQSFFIRNDYQSLSEATGRLQGWNSGLDMLSNLGIRDLFQFHSKIILSNDVVYDNFHNGLLQIIYNNGIIGAFIILIFTFRIVLTISNIVGKMKYLYIDIILLNILTIIFLSITESVFDPYQFVGKLFVLYFIILEKINYSFKSGQYLKRIPINNTL